jgi:phosphatidylinositol 4-kinase A
MIIHLEAEWDDAVLERFSLVVAQQSIHFALQLNWILQGAIEDYQPELPNGNINPTYNPLYYSRCIKLLTNIERCVVYRRPRSLELQRLYEKGKITKSEYQSLEQADRRFNALQLTAMDISDIDGVHLGGELLYKKAVRSACWKPKPWKMRYFAIEERMFNCYNTKGETLKRSMPLEGATVEAMPNAKYPYTFKVENRSFEFRMRASSQEEMDRWLKMLREEATTNRVFGHADRSMYQTTAEATRVIDEMTPHQRARFEFFRDERNFIHSLTQVAEDLRFEERDDRKKLAPGLMKKVNVPPCVYAPLLNSTDIFRRIHSTLYKETRVFNTKERCPTIMYFLGVRGDLEYKGEYDANMDVAEYMHAKFDYRAGLESTSFRVERVAEEEENDDKEDQKAEDGEDDQEPSMKNLESEREGEEDAAKVEKMFAGQRTTNGSNVWHDSVTNTELTAKTGTSGTPASPPGRGNRHLNKFLRESLVSVPRKLALHLDRQPSRRPSKGSGLSTATDLHTVKIVEGKQETPKKNSGVFVGRTSVMDHNKIIKGVHHEGDIDLESIDRATKVVCGGESWSAKSFRMLENAKNKPKDVQLEIVSLISKSNDDLRQEVFIMQMIHFYKSVFVEAGLPLWLKTYRILSTSGSTGLIEVLVDSTSIDGLKKSEGFPAEGGLRKYMEDTYGGQGSKSFKAAQRNFMLSLCGYSIVSYLLGLKDRHNGNIMIDTRCHIIHIDFGFAFGMAPGHEFSMERAAFKLTEEYLEVMDYPNGECYKEFERLFVDGFKAARKNSQIALGLVEIMMYQSNYPCFSGWRYGNGVALRRFEKRLMLDVPDDQVEQRALGLVRNAQKHWGTTAYDKFQHMSNGYAI